MTKTERVYGDAIYENVLEIGKTDEIKEEIALVREVFESEPKFFDFLQADVIPRGEKLSAIDEAFKGRIEDILLNFLKVLIEDKKISALCGSIKRYHNRYNEDHGIISVKAVSAQELTDEQKTRLEDRIRKITGKDPEVIYTVNPHVLGGMAVEYDGILTDGTLERKLKEISQTLKETEM